MFSKFAKNIQHLHRFIYIKNKGKLHKWKINGKGKIRTFGYIWIYKWGNKKMATVKNIILITEFLDKVSNLKEVEDRKIINIPDDVEADIGLKIKLKKGYDWLDVQHKINDIIWEIFENKGELLAVYEEFEE